MCLQPVLSFPAVGEEGDTEGEGMFHFVDDDLFHAVELLRKDRKVKFIVHLKNHFRLNAFTFKTLVDANHCHLDDVRCRALNRSVDSIALGITTYNGIARIDVR